MGGKGKLLAGGFCAFICMLQGGEMISVFCLLSWEGIQNYLKDNLGIQPGCDGHSSAKFLCCDLDLWQLLPSVESKCCSTEGRASLETGFVSHYNGSCARLRFLHASGL